MAEKEFIERITKEIVAVSEELVQATQVIKKEIYEVRRLDREEDLTIPILKKAFEVCSSEIEKCKKSISRNDHLFGVYKEDMTEEDLRKWENYHDVKVQFTKQHSLYITFAEEYKHFQPKNTGKIQNQVRNILSRKGFIVDSGYEGDYETWIGVYGRPEDMPTYLDATDGDEAALQERHAVGGFKQDFAQWFEWQIEEGQVKG